MILYHTNDSVDGNLTANL